MAKINKKYKDKLFRIIFRKKKDLLDLYNAINGTNYKNTKHFSITTLEDVVYMGRKNDLSFIVGNILDLYEHQSSFSPNLPLRGLLYFADLYRSYIEPSKKQLYSEKAFQIPLPQYIVFYNGTQNEPERTELRLSDLFLKTSDNMSPALECTAIMLNINLGHNRELMEKCHLLGEYAYFVALVREYLNTNTDETEAVSRAVDECIKNGVLSEILRKNKAEVIDVILTEWDEEEFREFLKEEAKESGFQEGREAGLTVGRKEGLTVGREEGLTIGREEGIREGIRALIITCQSLHVSKEETLHRITECFSMNEETAKAYIDEFWKI